MYCEVNETNFKTTESHTVVTHTSVQRELVVGLHTEIFCYAKTILDANWHNAVTLMYPSSAKTVHANWHIH